MSIVNCKECVKLFARVGVCGMLLAFLMVGAHRVLVFYVPTDTLIEGVLTNVCVCCILILVQFTRREVCMARSKMGRGKSRRTFRNGAERQHPANRMNGYLMRGGIRW